MINERSLKTRSIIIYEQIANARSIGDIAGCTLCVNEFTMLPNNKISKSIAIAKNFVRAASSVAHI